MNHTRVALAAVTAWVVDSIYGFAVFANLLGGQFGAHPGVFRPMETMNLPVLFIGTLLALFALAYIYAKGYEGRSGIQEGFRFGVCIGSFVLGYVAIGNYATLNIGRGLAVSFAIAVFIEMIVVGVTIGAVYKPGLVRQSVRA